MLNDLFCIGIHNSIDKNENNLSLWFIQPRIRFRIILILYLILWRVKYNLINKWFYGTCPIGLLYNQIHCILHLHVLHNVINYLYTIGWQKCPRWQSKWGSYIWSTLFWIWSNCVDWMYFAEFQLFQIELSCSCK